MARQEGRTAEQMKALPKGAVFVWCNKHLQYPQALARDIGRDDLKIVSPSWLDNSWRGLTFSGIELDHAAKLTVDQWEGYDGAKTRVRANVG